MKSDKSCFLVLLPTLNEVENVGKVIADVKALGIDIVVSDGGSIDGTVDLVLSAGVKIIPRFGKGKGSAISDALTFGYNSNKEFLLLTDSDGTYPIARLIDFMEIADDFDMIVGVRDYKSMTFQRKLANKFMNFYFFILYGTKVKDMASGFRLLRIDKFYGNLSSDNFDVEPEINSVAIRNNLRILEIDVEYYHRKSGSKTNVFHLIMVLFRMLYFRFKVINKP